MTAEASAEPTISRSRLRLLLAVLVIAVIVSVMNNSMVTVLLPAIRQDIMASAAAAGSVVAALAPALPVLAAARALQGIGAAAIPALSSVTVARVLPPGRRGLAFGVLTTGVGVGQALGPVLGGLTAELAG